MKKRIASLLVLVSLIVSAAVFPVSADFNESYESTVLPEDAVNAEISNEQAHTGLTSIKVFKSRKTTEPNTARFLELATPALTDTSVTGEMVAEGWFYDANGDSDDRDTLCASMPLIYFESADGQTKISVGAYRQTLNWGGGYDFKYYGCSTDDPAEVPENIGENSGFNAYSGSNGWKLVTNSAGNWITRSKGWHHVRVEVSPKNNGTNVIFDGNWVTWLQGKTSPIVKVQGFAHPWSDAYRRSKAEWLDGYTAFYDDFAIYSKAERTITVKYSGNGSVSDGEQALENGAAITVAGGSEKILTLTPDEGSFVSGVTVNGKSYFTDGTAVTIPSVIEDKVIEITFSQENKHAVSFETTAGGTVCEKDSSGELNNNVFYEDNAAEKTYSIKANSAEKYDIERIAVNGSEIPIQTTAEKNEKEISLTVDKAYEIKVWFKKNKAPVVKAASIRCNSIPALGDLLEIDADIADPDGDELAAAEYQWQRLSENTWADIEGAVNESYTLTGDDVGAKIRVKITPHSKRGITGGEAFTTEPTETVTTELRKSNDYYVSAENGSDLFNGSEEHPFKSIEKARDTIASVINDEALPEGTVTVYIRGGDYYVDSSLAFDANNSGTARNPVVYRAYEGEKVRLIGGKRLDISRVHKADDENILNKISDPAARELLCYIDLTGIEIPEDVDLAHQYNWDSIKHRFEIFVNGTALDSARWPNKNDVSGGWLQMEKPIQDTENNDGSCIAEFSRYEDSGAASEQALKEKTSSWSEDSVKNLRIAGYVPYTWSYMEQGVSGLDSENLTIRTLGNRPSYGLWWNTGGGRFYFYNILEELDMPGESFIDRENNRIYFYPSEKDLSDAEIFVPSLEQPILTINGASNITFKNLSMLYSREKAVSAENVDNVWIDGCEIAHTCDLAGYMSGKNSGVKNSHIYDTAKGGLKIDGGDRKTLTPGNMLVENCRIHSVDRVFKAWANMVVLTGVGNTLRGCDLYDADHELVSMVGNDHVLEYNKFYNAALETGDVGAIYYGDDQSLLGYEIRNNFFANIGNSYSGYGEQAIFWDDASIGPHISGNIFYRATRTKDCGADANGRYAAMKSFWGHFGLAENNMFIDVPVIGRFESRKEGSQTYQDAADSATYWWKALMNSSILAKQPSWSKIQNSSFDFINWKEHYKGTQWEQLYDIASNEIKAAYDAADDEGKQKLAEKYAPGRSNVVRNNVGIGLMTDELRGYNGASDANGTIENTYSMSLAEGKSIFADYGNDFTITEEGMEKINSVLPDFKEIRYSDMGCNGIGSNPSVSDVVIEGARVNNIASVNYTYSDPDGDKEGKSRFQWYISDSRDGKYKKIDGASGSRLMILPEYSGKYIKCSVVPQDSTFCYADKEVMSAAASVENDVSLNDMVNRARELLENTAAGEKLGNSSEQAISELEAQIAYAESLDNPDKAASDEAITKLASAMNKVYEDMVTEAVLKDGETAHIPFTNKAVKIELEGKSEITVPSGKELPRTEISGYVSVDGQMCKIILTIPEGTKAAEGGVLTLFANDANPSASISGTNITAVHFSGNAIDFSRPVRIELQGASGKTVRMTVKNSFAAGTAISEDSVSAAENRLDGKNGWCYTKKDGVHIGYTKALREMVVYTPSSPAENPEEGGGYGGGNDGNKVIGKGTSGGSVAGSTAGVSPDDGCGFLDIEGHWAKADIEEMYRKGVVSGVSAASFEPDRNVTRAEFAAIAVRALKLAEGSAAGFSDVTETDWFAPFVSAAANAGLICGYDGKFRPNDLITREEMAVVLAKAYEYLGYEPQPEKVLAFEDAGDISEWAYGSVSQMASAGLISGMTEFRFAGKENTTRAQSVSVISRLLAYSQK